MSAPREELYKFADYILSSSVSILKADGIESVPIQRATGSLTSPHVELSLLINAPTGRSHVSASQSEYDAFAFSLRALVITNRQTNDLTHSVYTSKVFNKLTDPRNFVMPYHGVPYLKPDSIVTGFDANAGLDHSTIFISGQIWIKNSAW